MILLTIEGIPTPWSAHKGYGRQSFNPKFKERQYYQWQIRSQWNQEIITQPVRLECVYFMPIPKGTSKIRKEQMLNGVMYHIKRPDTSNLTKFAEDCLKGIAIEDDSQVVEIFARKLYGLAPKTLIKIFPL